MKYKINSLEPKPFLGKVLQQLNCKITVNWICFELVPTAPNSRTTNCPTFRTALHCVLACPEGQGSPQVCRWSSGPESLLFLHYQKEHVQLDKLGRRILIGKRVGANLGDQTRPAAVGQRKSIHESFLLQGPGGVQGAKQGRAGAPAGAPRETTQRDSARTAASELWRDCRLTACHSVQGQTQLGISPPGKALQAGIQARERTHSSLPIPSSSGLRRCRPRPMLA